jgi:isocitrate dehydrogenase kinase/phosphatase
MSDTPELTRAADTWSVGAIEELARLKRERDEARHEIKGWRNKWDCAVTMAAKAEIERDEWKSIAKTRAETITLYQARAVRAEEELDNIREQYRIAIDMAALAQNKLFIAKAELERLKK